MIINGSSYIRLLKIKAVFDISGTTPFITLENQSEGDDLANVSYSFLVKSPSQTIIHEADTDNPDLSGLWTNHTISDAWPRPFNSIEWSGAPYTFQAIVKDGNGVIHYGDIQEAAICHPNGNTPASKNTFGVAEIQVRVKCDLARIYFNDATNASYKGLTGQLGSSVLRVNFPMDNTGVVPAPFTAMNFSNALVPITYSGKGYQFLAYSIYEYELSANTYVRIKYLKNDTFGVWCNIDLMPLCCEYQKLIDSIENGSCGDVAAAQQKLLLINPRFSLVIMGMMQPLIGIDVPEVIQEIIDIGGFNCDCCDTSTGVIPNSSAAFEGTNFIFTPIGGDIQGQFTVNGPNVTLTASDISYIFKICEGSPAQTTAFEVRQSTSGYTKTYCLFVDIGQLAEDLLNKIASDVNLVNLFNSIVLSANDGNFQLVVDGGCIFSNSASCDYGFTLLNIPANTTYAQLATLVTANQTYTLNYAFNLTNLAGLKAALDALGVGTFVVTNPSGSTVEITTSTAVNISQLIYKNPNATVAAMTKNCTGYVPLSANQVVQNIINYLCDIEDSQVATATPYQICYIDPDDHAQKTVQVAAGAPLNTFITELLARGCETIQYVKSLGAVDCDTIKDRFPANAAIAMQPNDIFLVTKGGQCAQVSPIEAFLTMLTYGVVNADVKAAFCAFVASCAGGLPCAPYNIFFAEADAGSPAGDTMEILVTFDHPDAISNTIRYARIDNTNTPVYKTISGILPGASPYVIAETPGLETGQYRVCIKPVYADGRACEESCYDTAACTGVTAFSAVYNSTTQTIDVTYSVSASAPKVKVNLTFPNGGSATYLYNNGDTISITPPPGVTGTFFATLQAVCNDNTGFYSAATAQAAFVINPPNNSVINNNSSNDQFAVSIFTFSPNSNQLVNAVLDAGQSLGFFIGDGTYSVLQIQVDTEDRDSMNLSLVTGSGTYQGTRSGSNYFVFNSVQILNGATLTLTDDSSPTADNYVLSSSYNYNILSVTGNNIPALPATGVNGNQSGVQTGMNGSYLINLTSSSPAPNTKLVMTKNNTTVIDCVAITGNGTYSLDSNLNGGVTAGDNVRIAVNFGPC